MSARRPSHRATKAPARIFTALGAFFWLVSGATPAAADDTQEFQNAKTRFDVGEYAEAVRLFTTMLDLKRDACAKGPTSGQCRLADAELIERARAFDTAALVALGRGPEADTQIKDILLNNPTYTPNPTELPIVVIDRFTKVRTDMKPELDKKLQEKAERDRLAKLAVQRATDAEKKWIDDIQRLASEERFVQRNSRALALVPFGVGQFQNGDRGYGVAFLVAEALLGGASIASGVVELSYIASASDAGVAKAQLGANIATVKTVNVAAFSAWITVSLLGIAQAQAAFVPERVEVRSRPIPPRPKIPAVAPTLSMLPGGVGVGLVGRF